MKVFKMLHSLTKSIFCLGLLSLLTACQSLSLSETGTTKKPLNPLVDGPFDQTNAEGYRALFNGKDLKNWVNINGHDTTWTVKDRMIMCTGKPICMLRTKKMYENFILELQWQHLKRVSNAGVFVWTGATPAIGQPFLKGIEIQIMAGHHASWYTSDGDIFPTWGATMVPAHPRWRQRSFPTEKRINPVPQWNHFKMVCVDGNISLHVNGKLVNQAIGCHPRVGYIALESEGGPINFKDIVIKELPPSQTRPTPDEISKQDQGYVNLYTSLKLKQWQITQQNKKHWNARGWMIHHDGQGDILWHKKKYHNFSLYTDFKWQGKAKALSKLQDDLAGAIFLKTDKQTVGIQLHAKGKSGTISYNTNRPAAPASQNADRRVTSWNRLEITKINQHITVKINGKVVNENINLKNIQASQIGIFSNSKMSFGNILLKELP